MQIRLYAWMMDDQVLYELLLYKLTFLYSQQPLLHLLWSNFSLIRIYKSKHL